MILISELLAEIVSDIELVVEPATSPRITPASADVEVFGVTHDSRSVAPGTMFACLRGTTFDGHDHAADAVASGAVALLVDHELGDVESTAQLVVDDTRRALGPVSALVYERPSRTLTTVGITGTNGKTTTAQLTASIFEANGWTTGVVGTLHGTRTTPEAPELQQTLASFRDDGAAAAVLEVSSHALALHRVDGTEFDAVVFTNLGRDHLDLHGSTEEYFRAKAQLFQRTFAPLAVINTDDPYGRLLADVIAAREDPADEMRLVEIGIGDVTDIEVSSSSHSYRWRGIEVRVPIGGRFNVSNSLSALVTAVELGVDPAVAVAGLADVEAIPGRFESIVAAERFGFSVIVDYAHTPDGLAEVLASARAVADPGSAVIVVFGAGGGRDREKRPEMGAVAARLADRVVVTSDNPRLEDPMDIIGDILTGMHDSGLDAARTRPVVEPDRRAAIAAALQMARRGDVVVIAGKGHEQTQDLGGELIAFDDRAVARQLVEELA